MSERNARLLDLISHAWCNMSFLASTLGAPEASIRRSIQELRRDGYYVVLDGKQARAYGKRQALIADQDDHVVTLNPGSSNVGGDDDGDYQK